MTWSEKTLRLISAAIDEDLAEFGDVTGAGLPAGQAEIAAAVVPRAQGVLSGLRLAPAICRAFSERLGSPVDLNARPNWKDGDRVAPRKPIAKLRGEARAVLTAERTLLNFLGRMSGVATLTDRFVRAARAANPHVRILDTRKTLPGWRELDRYAVRCGGGTNHRFGLFDAVLVKDNHIAGVAPTELPDFVNHLLDRIDAVLPNRPPPSFVAVEVDSLAQLDAILSLDRVHIVLLDNFDLDGLRAAVAMRDARGRRGQVELEASGGVRLETVADIAATGVDRISVGALTHSAVNLDFGLDR